MHLRSLLVLAPLILLACNGDDGDDANATAVADESGASADDEVADDDDDGGDASASTDPGDEGDEDDGSSGPIDDAEDGEASDESSTDDGSTDDGPETGADQLPPTGGAALLPWLEAETYAGWAAESAPHVSAGPHGAGVRTFFNTALADAAAEGMDAYPVGAATVKQLLDAQGDRSGWAVMVKLELGQGGEGWYWYEILGASVYADRTGEALCTGCHAVGIDWVRTAWPLQ